MVEGRQRDQWAHTAEVLAMIANTMRNPKKRRKPFTGRQFYPFGRERRSKAPAADIKTVIEMYGLKTRQTARDRVTKRKELSP